MGPSEEMMENRGQEGIVEVSCERNRNAAQSTSVPDNVNLMGQSGQHKSSITRKRNNLNDIKGLGSVSGPQLMH